MIFDNDFKIFALNNKEVYIMHKKFGTINKDEKYITIDGKPMHLVIPLATRKCFVSLIPQGNYYNPSINIELSLESEQGDTIDRANIKILDDITEPVRVIHNPHYRFPMSNESDEVCRSKEQFIHEQSERFQSLIRAIETIFNENMREYYAKPITASIHNSPAHELQDGNDLYNYLLSSPSRNIYVSIFIDYRDDVSSIAVQVEDKNANVLDRIMIDLPQEPSERFTVMHDKDFVIYWSDIRHNNDKQHNDYVQKERNKIKALADDLSNLLD